MLRGGMAEPSASLFTGRQFAFHPKNDNTSAGCYTSRHRGQLTAGSNRNLTGMTQGKSRHPRDSLRLAFKNFAVGIRHPHVWHLVVGAAWRGGLVRLGSNRCKPPQSSQLSSGEAHHSMQTAANNLTEWNSTLRSSVREQSGSTPAVFVYHKQTRTTKCNSVMKLLCMGTARQFLRSSQSG